MLQVIWVNERTQIHRELAQPALENIQCLEFRVPWAGIVGFLHREFSRQGVYPTGRNVTTSPMPWDLGSPPLGTRTPNGGNTRLRFRV